MGKIKAVVSLADAVAQLTGRQVKKLAEKLGLDPKRNLSENRLRTAVADEGQKYIKQKNKDSDRLVGATTLAAGVSTAYSVGQFFRDMLGIKTMGDATLKTPKAKADVIKKPVSKPSKKSTVKTPPSKPKIYKTIDGKVLTEQQYLEYLDEGQDITAKNKTILEKVTGNKGNKGMLVNNKKRFGNMDYRKGGMVIK